MNQDPPLPSGPEENGQVEDRADVITTAAQRRALGGSRQLRQISAVLWASFLGATATIAVIVSAPALSHLIPPHTPQQLALVFIIAWGLAAIPALIAAVLATPVKPENR